MTQAHEHWSSKIGFILATAGSAVGLGALWRFPYIAGTNGGGAFVILYLLFTFLLGFPVFIAELIIGRKTQKSAVMAYSTLSGGSENWRGLGWLNFLTSLIILSFYGVVAGWVLSYVFMSLGNFSVGKTPAEIEAVFTTLYKAPWINVFWFGLFLLINLAIVSSGIKKGIERWSKILMPLLFLFLMALFIYSTTLSGFGDAVAFVFVPDFSALRPESVLNALGMAFFTLSVGYGIIVTYGSYMKKSENIPKNGFYVAIMTVLVSLISALVIFPIVFTYNLPPQAGPGLVFKTLPVLFAKIPATLLLSTSFFLLMLFATLTSTISLLEILVANVMEVFNIERKKAGIYLTILAFVIGIPSAFSGAGTLFPNWEAIYGKNFFDMMDYITLSWFTPIAALLTIIFVGWTQEKKMLFKEFTSGTHLGFLATPWYWIVKYIAPLVVLFIILHESGLISL
ncbi:sodium-dependent transporter [bacterium]|nr:sodium-dependent transporter [bacterium]